MYTRKTGLAALGAALMLLTTLCWPASAQNPAATHDFNDDGYSDFAWRDNSGDVVIWLLQNGNVVAQSGILGTMSAAAGWLFVGEANFLGIPDSQLLWQNITTGQLVIWTVVGFGDFAVNTYNVPQANSNWVVVGSGDFNAAGNDDILWRNQLTGQVGIWLMSNGSVSSQAIVNAPGDLSWAIVGTGDFNGDGMADILWQNASTGAVSIWFMNGTQIISEAGVGTENAGWSIAGTGDFNGDGMADILWRGPQGEVGIWLMNGATPTAQAVVASANGAIINTGDYNGDGMSDIAFQNTGEDILFIWCMSGTQIISCGGSPTQPAAGWYLQGPGELGPAFGTPIQ
jgi:hypothetical protein